MTMIKKFRLSLVLFFVAISSSAIAAPIAFFEKSIVDDDDEWVLAYENSKSAQRVVELVAEIAENPDEIYCGGSRFGYPWGPLWGAEGLPGGCLFVNKFDGSEWEIGFEGYAVVKTENKYFAVNLNRDVRNEDPPLFFHDGGKLTHNTEDFENWWSATVDRVNAGKIFEDISPLRSDEVDDFLSDFWNDTSQDNDWGLVITGATISPLIKD